MNNYSLRMANAEQNLSSLMQNLSLFNNYQGDVQDYPSTSSNVNFRSYSTAQTPGVYPITTNLLSVDFSDSGRLLYRQILLQRFLTDLYRAIFDSANYSDFIWVLSDSGKTVIDSVLKKMAAYPDQMLIMASCDVHASKVIKKLISLGKKSPYISMIPKIFASRVVTLMNNQHGRHVVQQCFTFLDKLSNMPLSEEVVKRWLDIANDKYGCIALQNCIDYIDDTPQLYYAYHSGSGSYNASLQEHLLVNISEHAAMLALDTYGNFILQRVIRMNIPVYNIVIAEGIKHLYETLCTNKSGSYLVEQFLNTPFRSYVAEELLSSSKLIPIAQHEFGNYVIQKLIKRTKVHDAPLYRELCKKLLQDLDKLQCSVYGRKVANLLKYQQKEDEAIEEKIIQKLEEQSRAMQASCSSANLLWSMSTL
ncbi:pumilio homolog 12 [Beta vulgaris subsp. vulgaris]|uniref:pumilio homolog 12 n=1 Tax=Beta vulgaris subsp. vulgaris TaxID=3555 RepID=UPI000900FAEB|nr:pumilio homolog 12 [Beta vulgaris subsp. vulgaris]